MAVIRLTHAAIEGSTLEIVPGATSSLCARDGVVGMDLLEACVLHMRPEGLSASCGEPQ